MLQAGLTLYGCQLKARRKHNYNSERLLLLLRVLLRDNKLAPGSGDHVPQQQPGGC